MMKLVFDIGRVDNRVEQVPKCHYDFVTIYNNTRFDFVLYSGNSILTRDIIGACPAYTILTFPHDKLVDYVNFVWSGGAGIVTAENERCKIFFTAENMGLVGEFRPPEVSVVAPPPQPAVPVPQTIFAGIAAVMTVIPAQTRRVIIQAIYIGNTLATGGTITLVHRVAGSNRNILTGSAVAANTTLSLGYMVINPGDELLITAVTGTITFLVYGEI